MRAVVLTPIPTPYRDPFWNVVAQHENVDLTVLYCRSGKADRPWSTDWHRAYAHEVLPTRNLLGWRGPDASCYWYAGIGRHLSRLSPDLLVVGGYNHVVMLAAMHWACKRGVPYFLMSETYQRVTRNPVKRILKAQVVGRVVRHMTGGFPTGRWACEYLRDFGANADALTYLPNVPDVKALQAQASVLRPRQAELRREHGLPVDRPLILFVGRLIQKKNATHLLHAFGRIAGQTDACLAVVGDGPLRASLQALSEQLGVADRTRFAGFVQPEEMPTWYAMADLFVLPSAETWGVVVLEAVASGLPVVVSDRVGCHPDVVTGPEIGDVFRLGDADALANILSHRLLDASPTSLSHSRGESLAPFEYTALSRAMISAWTGRFGGS